MSMEPAAKMTSILTNRVDGIDSFGFLVVSILEGQGFKAATLPYANEGVNIPGLSLIASDDTIKKAPDLVRKMVMAMEEAIAASRKDPEGAIDSLMKRSPTLNRPVVLQNAHSVVRPDRSGLGQGQVAGLDVTRCDRQVAGYLVPVWRGPEKVAGRSPTSPTSSSRQTDDKRAPIRRSDDADCQTAAEQSARRTTILLCISLKLGFAGRIRGAVGVTMMLIMQVRVRVGDRLM